MGTKRVGWARIRSLINENTNTLQQRRRVVRSALTSDTTLTSADYGKLILIDASAASTNFTITLPSSPETGATLQFLLVADSHSASQPLLDSGSGATINGYAMKTTADLEDGLTYYHASQKFVFDDGAKKGARITIVCTAANTWFITDAVSNQAILSDFD